MYTAAMATLTAGGGGGGCAGRAARAAARRTPRHTRDGRGAGAEDRGIVGRNRPGGGARGGQAWEGARGTARWSSGRRLQLFLLWRCLGQETCARGPCMDACCGGFYLEGLGARTFAREGSWLVGTFGRRLCTANGQGRRKKAGHAMTTFGK
jgi:hypothetical protein